MTIQRTAFSENYTRKFARSIAQVLTKVKNMREKPVLRWDATAYALQGIKRLSSSGPSFSAKRAKLKNSSLIEPTQMPAKRRRINEKSPDQNISSLCDKICAKISEIAPLVGRKIIQDPQILQDVIKVVVCKGTERTIQPAKDMIPSEAPYRKAIVVQRKTKKILVEDQWEHWEFLSARQQWRRSHPSYLNTTAFARNHPVLDQEMPTSSENASPAIRESASPEIQAREPASAAQSPETLAESPFASQLQMPSPASPSQSDIPIEIDETSTDHGPKFLALTPAQKKLALRLHKNLGHPDPRRLSQVLQQRGYDHNLAQGVLDLKCSVVPPDAHWQCGRIERLKVPASITSDDSLPAYAIADSENNAGLRFRELLAMRENARHAFHSADNDMALRRAALRRDRPHRGAYEEGEWVMVWKVQKTKVGENIVWRAELEFSQSLLESVCNTAEKPTEEEFLFLATAGKKQRTEVKLSTLDPSERLEFEKAKSKEVQNWLQTGTVERMFRHELSPEQILRCRWLYVWKPVEDPEEQKEIGGRSRKAKARLVVLGYMDPQLDTIPRDSPTLGRTSNMFIGQVIASMRWTLMSFDIKAAFLQGRIQDGRNIAIEPVPEMIKAMNLKETEVCRLVNQLTD
eukprot:s2915_g7.t1